MLVCQDCGSHRIAETGGTDLVAECPKCGLPVREGDVGVSSTDAEGLAHTTCPEPGTPLRPGAPSEGVKVDTTLPTSADYALSSRQDHLAAGTVLAQSGEAGAAVLADVPVPDVAPIPADAPALQDPASAALIAAGAPVGPPANPEATPADVAPAAVPAAADTILPAAEPATPAPSVEDDDQAKVNADAAQLAADEDKLEADAKARTDAAAGSDKPPAA